MERITKRPINTKLFGSLTIDGLNALEKSRNRKPYLNKGIKIKQSNYNIMHNLSFNVI